MKKLARLALPIALLSSLFLAIPGASAAFADPNEPQGPVPDINGRLDCMRGDDPVSRCIHVPGVPSTATATEFLALTEGPDGPGGIAVVYKCHVSTEVVTGGYIYAEAWTICLGPTGGIQLPIVVSADVSLYHDRSPAGGATNTTPLGTAHAFVYYDCGARCGGVWESIGRHEIEFPYDLISVHSSNSFGCFSNGVASVYCETYW